MAKPVSNPRKTNINPQAAQIQHWFNNALALHQKGELEKARALYKKVLTAHPRHADAWHLVGVLAAQAEQYKIAEDAISKAISIHPTAPIYYNNLANVYRWQERPEKARGLFEKAIALDPEYAEPYNNLGVVEKETGNLEKAAELYNKALRLNPKYADAWSNLGVLHLQLGEMDSAKNDLQRAVEIAPQHAEAHYNLGLVIRAEGDIEPAIRQYEKAVHYKPNYVDAYLQMGHSIEELGHSDQALKCFQEGLKWDPESAPAKLGLARSFLHLNQAEKSKELIEEVIDKRDQSAHAYSMLGNVLRTLGDMDAAIDSFEKSLELLPDNPSAYQGLAMTQRLKGLDQKRIEVLQQQAESEKTNSDQRIAAHFSLGKMYDDAELFDQAFAHFSQGNQLKQTEYNPQDIEAWVDAIIAAFSRDFFASTGAIGDPTAKPIFVVGLPRSGTTLTEQILASHNKVYGGGERNYINALANNRLDAAIKTQEKYPASAARLTPALAKELAQGYLNELPEEASDALRVVDKMPINTHHLGLIALLFPNAKIIHAKRNLMDTALSCFFQNFRVGQKFSTDLQNIGHYIRNYQKIMAHWEQALPLPIYPSQYEELVADLEGASRRLVDFIGLEWDQGCLEFYQNNRPVYTASVWQVRQPVYGTSVERWRNYEKHLAPLIQALGNAEKG